MFNEIFAKEKNYDGIYGIFLKINLLHKSTRKENLLKETSMEIARMLMHKKISEADFRRKLSSIVRKKDDRMSHNWDFNP